MNKKIKVESPGRINLIGEHVDYNGGSVLPGAIDKKVEFTVENIPGNKCFIESKTINKKFEFDFSSLEKSTEHWQNYILGTVNNLINKKNQRLSAFSCEINSSLPIGAGISSSSALISGLAWSLIEINNLEIKKNEIVDIVSDVEHNYIGLKGGIMDQFTILNGQKNKLIHLECHSRNFKYVNAEFKDYQIILLNTNVEHNLANTAYNDRVEECNYALKLINEKYSNKFSSLCEVDLNIIESLKNVMDVKIFNRASFVINENLRTNNAAKKLNEFKLMEIGNLMYQSHAGLKDLYEVSCNELDYLVDLTKAHDQIIGSRMMGGGFGGCTINLIHKKFTDEFIDEASRSYFEKFSINLTPIEINISDGVKIKNLQTD
tara:strand:+ start:115 stop:1242 length:1128 start_codon:yes stop_codon:yes gene_type:complete